MSESKVLTKSGGAQALVKEFFASASWIIQWEVPPIQFLLKIVYTQEDLNFRLGGSKLSRPGSLPLESSRKGYISLDTCFI